MDQEGANQEGRHSGGTSNPPYQSTEYSLLLYQEKEEWEGLFL